MSLANATAAGPSGLGLFFVDTSALPATPFGDVQILFLVLVYGYILYLSAKLIADGSELLSVVLDPGLVGGLLLPVMGAVPDCAIVLFSGLGDDAQNQLKVGVGTLAGSTIMLLTLPWLACAWAGRVDIVSKARRGGADEPLVAASSGSAAAGELQCNYSPRGGAPKLTPGLSWADTLLRTGIQTPASIDGAAKLMLLSCVSYLVIQGPAFAFASRAEGEQAHDESPWALAGLLTSAAAFVAFSAYCVYAAGAVERQAAQQLLARERAVAAGVVNILTLMQIEDDLKAAAGGSGAGAAPAGASASAAAPPSGGEGAGAGASSKYLHTLFTRLDADGSGSLDHSEVRVLLTELGMGASEAELGGIMRSIGGADELVQFHEFEAALHKFSATAANAALLTAGRAAPTPLPPAKAEGAEEGEEEGEGGEEEEEEEDGAAGLTPLQIKGKALAVLSAGMVLCVIFSDPMVDALTEIGRRWGVSPFYVSFLITPVVSNASELLSSLQFSARKTRRSIDMTYSQLLGAATMNNT